MSIKFVALASLATLDVGYCGGEADYFGPFDCKCDGDEFEIVADSIPADNFCDYFECISTSNSDCTQCVPEARIWPSGKIGKGDWITFTRPFHVCEQTSVVLDECELDDEETCSPNDILDMSSSFNFACEYIDGRLSIITQHFPDSSNCTGISIVNPDIVGPASAIIDGVVRSLNIPGIGEVVGIVEIVSCCDGVTSDEQCRIEHDSADIITDEEDGECDITFRRRGPPEGVCSCQYDKASNTMISEIWTCDRNVATRKRFTYPGPPRPPRRMSCQERFGKECNWCKEDVGCMSCRPFYDRVKDKKTGLYECKRGKLPGDKPSQGELKYMNSMCKTDNCLGDKDEYALKKCEDERNWGCKKCIDGYFRKNNDFPCVSCDIIPECKHCNVDRNDRDQWGGCDECNPGFELKWDFFLGYRRCEKVMP